MLSGLMMNVSQTFITQTAGTSRADFALSLQPPLSIFAQNNG